MSLKKFFVIFVLAVSTTSFASNVDRANEFLNVLLKLSDAVKSKGDVAEQKKLTNQLNESIDFEALARKSLGKHWTAMSKAKQTQFIDLLKEMIEKILYPKARKINSKIGDVKFSTIPGKPLWVKAMTKYEYEKAGDVVSRDAEIDLVFRSSTPKAKIADAVLEGEQVSANLGRQFNQILEKRTMDDVMAKMRQKLNAPEGGLAGPQSSPVTSASKTVTK